MILPEHENSAMAGIEPWLAIVGIGEDGVEGLTAKARGLIESAALVVGGKRHLQLAQSLIRGEAMAWASPIADTIPILLARRDRPVAVLASGDPFYFGVGSKLARHVPAAEMIVVPQVSSIALAAGRLGWSQPDVETVTLCGRPLETIRPRLRDRARLLVLSAGAETPAEVAAYMTQHGFGPSRLHVFEAVGGPHERCRTTTAAGFDLAGIGPLNLIGVEVEAEVGVRSLPTVPGRSEDWFENDGQITKAEIRAITLASLGPAPEETLWDIGCGSGSVSIEWLLACPAAKAVAVDRRRDRLDRAGRNAASLGVPRLDLCEGMAPDVFSTLPAPNAVFLGGGAGDPAVLAGAWGALPTGGRLVANAVTLETQTALSDAFQRHGGRLTRIAIERLEPVGSMHGFRPAMTVLHYAVTKP